MTRLHFTQYRQECHSLRCYNHACLDCVEERRGLCDRCGVMRYPDILYNSREISRATVKVTSLLRFYLDFEGWLLVISVHCALVKAEFQFRT